MKHYAVLNESDVCVSISSIDDTLFMQEPRVVQIEEPDEALVGKMWTGDGFVDYVGGSNVAQELADLRQFVLEMSMLVGGDE